MFWGQADRRQGAKAHISNFSHLAVHDEQLARLGALAEHGTWLRDDFSPDACVEIRKQGRRLLEGFKLRFKEYKLDKKVWELLTVDEQFVGGAAFPMGLGGENGSGYRQPAICGVFGRAFRSEVISTPGC